MVGRFSFDSYVQFGGSPMAASVFDLLLPGAMAAAAFATLIGFALAVIVI
ncbi:hypothetical protein [Raineyella sp. W15-4]|nr:hypothetical protein [Raineyella sp. W15-4]WOQ17657.1 hypothetical protein R0145_02800 [Raineyella sp. W15-4]